MDVTKIVRKRLETIDSSSILIIFLITLKVAVFLGLITRRSIPADSRSYSTKVGFSG